jgi:hypothetical protein
MEEYISLLDQTYTNTLHNIIRIEICNKIYSNLFVFSFYIFKRGPQPVIENLFVISTNLVFN